MRRPDRFSRFAAAGLAALMTVIATGSALSQTIPLRQVETGHYVIDVMINETGPYPFAIDTGASHTAIAQPVAEILGFQPANLALDDIQTLTTQMQAERFQLDNLTLPDMSPRTVNSVVVPVAPDSPQHIAGLLGADLFVGRNYRIEFSSNRLLVGGVRAVHGDGVVDGERNLLFGAASVSQGRQMVRVLVDTGSQVTFVNRHVEHLLSRNRLNVVTTTGVDGRIEEDTDWRNVTNLRIGSVCIGRLSALEADLEIFEALDWDREPAMVLGMDVLRHAAITVDRQAGVFDIQASNLMAYCPEERVQFNQLDQRS